MRTPGSIDVAAVVAFALVPAFIGSFSRLGGDSRAPTLGRLRDAAPQMLGGLQIR